MKLMQSFLDNAGYQTVNIDYPSTRYSVEHLAREFVLPQILEHMKSGETVHFVTHSMGGIIVRYLVKQGLIEINGRVVMLSPPNHGSPVVDKIGNWLLFRWLNGPAGRQLGTGEESLPVSLGPVDFEVGVITGTRTINLILSCMIQGQDDGKVSVESAKVDGMTDFLIEKVSHPFIMNHHRVQAQVIYFLQNGVFKRQQANGTSGLISS